ncbi:MAG: hypothetical protein A2729_00910 [Candidatus Buchananbacteria bacterium RIFCSPHIGHO2_01_FULL_39_14]|uniref:DUF1573 domain-containing protein n=2 Tax=Candidatus Buchananiibacteriota TaxID=1817903 RepID=A0A1G1YUG2_9BACT|nr:MAG: hypothetical protein A2729_00910 [Candidatus Buchananbacteria bacterium RIFCSPHIGHO2_01_FULL_39_14]OGY49528.1 MAG: hypothetical protein A3D39_00240 [Candidatus Buchananbacteria bacterium RIFCSPHIGHO2_02_FULL_39_17]OGY55995.1 MAG: hypothetical protein A2912_03390 [Candidatus Buchananbacteria bacterium RIFCSPLOWO2_01_FULL_40_23b]
MVGQNENSTNIFSQNKEIIIGLVVALLILGGIIWLAKASSSADQVNPPLATINQSIVVPIDTYDFGTISMAKGKVSYSFTIKNSASQSLMLKKIYTSCMCTSATLVSAAGRRGPFGMPGHGVVPLANYTLKPNEEAQIEVTFDPAAHGPAGVGPVNRIVYLEDQFGAVNQLRISATVTP